MNKKKRLGGKNGGQQRGWGIKEGRKEKRGPGVIWKL